LITVELGIARKLPRTTCFFLNYSLSIFKSIDINETMENIIRERHPTGNYFYIVALGVVAVRSVYYLPKGDDVEI